jgi:hypothetical protein
MAERHAAFMYMLKNDYEFRLNLSIIHTEIYNDDEFMRLLARALYVRDLKDEIEQRMHTTRSVAAANPSFSPPKLSYRF